MNIPSLQNILAQTLKVIKDYPMVCLSALTGVFAALQLTAYIDVAAPEEGIWVKLLMTGALGLPAFLALNLRSRYRQLNLTRKGIEYGMVMIILIWFFYTVDVPAHFKDYFRFYFLNIAAHLMVACAGFIFRGSTAAFWQFNKHLFLRIVTTLIFSMVLFGGLSAAIASLDALFDFHIKEVGYLRLFIIIMGLFNTLFFLSGIPQDAQALEEEKAYPKVLKIFTQYVLVPLVVVYLIILLAYEAKIMIQWQLPKGWVSNLIIAYGIVGILSILLIYPIREEGNNRWVKIFAKWFYILLLPLVALMFLAIYTRLNSYGFTEERTIVLCLAVWLAATALHFLLKPKGDIRFIPASLAVVALFLSMAATPISKNSQQNRLAHLLQQNGLLVNGKIKAVDNPTAISFKDKKNISSIVYYLLEMHGNKTMEEWFSTDSLSQKDYAAYENAGKIMGQIGLEYVDAYAQEPGTTPKNKWIRFYALEEAIAIENYNYALPFIEMNFHDTKYQPGKGKYILRDENEDILEIWDENEKLITVDLRQFLDSLIKNHSHVAIRSNENKLPASVMSQAFQTDKWLIRIYYNTINGYTDTSKGTIHVSGMMLFKKK